MQRLTNQKQVILDYVQSVYSHPTAEEVYLAVKRKLPRISLGTVYRNLENFAEEGTILELRGRIKRYDGNTSNHQHFICTNCDHIFDIFEKSIDLNKIRKKIYKIGRIKRYDFYIYGICRSCHSKNNKKIK